MNGQSGNFILIVEISTNNQAWLQVGGTLGNQNVANENMVS